MRHVDSLVAEGCTNPQIAERLFMKPATMKTHLTHIFTKLAIAKRSELTKVVLARNPW